MSAIIDLRRRIQSVRNSQQITQAMKTVATSGYRRAQRQVVARRPFWHTFPELVISLTRELNLAEHPYLQVRPEKRLLVVVITSDKGLCGAFNSNLLNMAAGFLGEKEKNSQITIIPIGKKAVNFSRNFSWPVAASYSDGVEKKITAISQSLGQYFDYEFTRQNIDAIYLLYNEFRSVVAPRLTVTRLLPLAADLSGRQVERLEPIWEQEASTIINYLLKFYLKIQLEHVLFESQAAEQAARMMAMENASRNAEEIISDLVLLLNKMRQAAITKELLEIQTTVEALQ
ncbi:MAG TPA: ATP synthase F1 subunit gamma [Candidatus Saccharicenans sp.]|nr:ATP synthase F1 subunit gamma [Candidatus Saccharicenans sp.]HRD02504.1 ATP synthase F1 subunit gamma [Candidatus Saccharicenans sp.]